MQARSGRSHHQGFARGDDTVAAGPGHADGEIVTHESLPFSKGPEAAGR